jgi:hypothetical protein
VVSNLTFWGSGPTAKPSTLPIRDLRAVPGFGEVNRLTIDELLHFATLKGSGSMVEWRAACQAVGVPNPWTALRIMSDLGHVDSSLTPWKFPVWSCSPAILTGLPLIPSKALLCGARTPRLASAIRESLPGSLRLQTEPQQSGPEIWSLEQGSPSEFAQYAPTLSMQWQDPPASRILSRVIPPAEAYLKLTSRRRAPPGGRGLPELWDPPTARWNPQPYRGTSEGLWRMRDRFGGAWVMLIQIPGWGLVEVGDLGIAQIVITQKLGHSLKYIDYDLTSHRFRVARGYQLPRLHSRALCLCSGFLPRADPEGGQSYTLVPPSIAKNIQELLSCGRPR